MLFNSLEFLLFWGVLALILKWVKGGPAIAVLAWGSLFFYAFTGEVWYLAPLLISSVIDYFAGAKIHEAQRNGSPAHIKKLYLWLSLTANLGMLGYFKYWTFLLKTWASISGAESVHPIKEIILPAGISFYTFQTMCYTIDIYRGLLTPAKSFLNYMAYVSFFPQLVAGPIARYQDLGAHLEQYREGKTVPQWQEGVALFAIGLCKKVLIADRIANGINPLILRLDECRFGTSWLLLIGYSLQLYFDFSGYSDMAVGLGRCFGIDLPINFNSPYKARNPSDFWRRWHITLSEWIRDYIYFPLGGNRGGQLSAAKNLVLTMTIGGLWHGANWTFVVWGLYHGLLLAIYHWIKASYDAMPVALQRTIMLLLAFIGWVPFRAETFTQAGHWFSGLLGAHGLIGGDVLSREHTALILVSLVIATQAPNAHEMKFDAWDSKRWLGLGMVTSVALLLMNYSSTFIYYRF